MHKNKHKQPPKNFFRYFVDEYILFRRDFVIETSASIENCANQLRQLSHEKQGCWNSRRILVSVTNISSKRHFKISTKQPAKRIYMESASAEGSIERYIDATTFVSGTVLMSGWQYWAAIIGLGSLMVVTLVFGGAYDVLRNNWVIASVYFGSFGVLISYSWLKMYTDRNYLVQQIQHAIQNAEREAHLSKAKNEQIIERFDDSSEYQSQRKGES
jgi:hypothetical protein